MNLTAPSSIVTLLDKNPNYFRCSICKKLNFLSLEKSKKKNEYSVLEICQNHHKNEFSVQNYISEKQTTQNIILYVVIVITKFFLQKFLFVKNVTNIFVMIVSQII